MAAAEQAIRTALPLRTRLSEAWLYVFDGLRWHGRVRMGFATRELR
jgi:hypothetical protein